MSTPSPEFGTVASQLAANGYSPVPIRPGTKRPPMDGWPGFRLDDCATQRNLSAKGRADAARIGARLRSERIAVERIISSPWCRCMDTATLLELGPVEAEPTFGNVVVLREQATSLIAGARAVIDKWTGSGILLVVTHGANIRALTGIAPASGEIVVVRSGSGGNTEPVGRLTLD